MIRFVVVLLTLISTGLHALYGCHWHHGCVAQTACGTHCTHTSVPAADLPQHDHESDERENHDGCGCNHEDSETPADVASTRDHDDSEPENNREQVPGDQTPCDGTSCTFVVAPQSIVRGFAPETTYDASLIVTAIDDASSNTQNSLSANRMPMRFGYMETVRAHLVHQVWLL